MRLRRAGRGRDSGSEGRGDRPVWSAHAADSTSERRRAGRTQQRLGSRLTTPRADVSQGQR